MSGTGTFTNTGTLVKDAGNATTTVGVPLENTGTINVQSGTLSPIAGGSSNGGTWTTTNGGQIGFSTNTFTSTNDNAPGAKLAVSGGTLHGRERLDDGTRLALPLRHGAPGTVGAVHVAKAFTATGNGAIAGGGTVTLESTATGTLEASSGCTLLTVSGSGTTLANDGTLHFTGFTNEGNNSELNLAEGARLRQRRHLHRRRPGHLRLRLRRGQLRRWGRNLPQHRHPRQGRRQRDDHDRRSIRNTGTVNVQSGMFSPVAGGSSTGGTWTTAAGSLVAFSTGTFNSTNDNASAAQFAVSGGVLSVPSAATTVSTLALTGSGALDAGGALTVAKSFTATGNPSTTAAGRSRSPVLQPAHSKPASAALR